MSSPGIPPQASYPIVTAMCECAHHWFVHRESGRTARDAVCHGYIGSATPGPLYEPCRCTGFRPWSGPRDARTGEPVRPLTMAVDARQKPNAGDIPPQATRDAWPLWLHEHTNGLPCSEQTYKELKAAFLGGWQAAAPHLAGHAHGPLTAVRVDPGCQACQEIAEAVAAERSRLFVAIRHGIGLDKPWRGEALDVIDGIWREGQP